MKRFASTKEQDHPGSLAGVPLAGMDRLEKRQWWLWSSAISVSLVLGIGLASFAVPALLSADSFYAFFLDHAVRGLLGLVLIFNLYVVYEQVQLNRIRRSLADGLYKMAIQDPVTEMFNRRYVLYRIDEEISRCQRHGNSLAVIAFDLDSFKQINDQHGHELGDYALRLFGKNLKKAIRRSDVAARYGGDEFLAVLPDCKVHSVTDVLMRLDNLLASCGSPELAIRYSAGWTDYIPGESARDLLKRADLQLYEKKRREKPCEPGPNLDSVGVPDCSL